MAQQQEQSLKMLEEKLREIKEPEIQLNEIILFMEQTLSQETTPRFKQFWDARKLCLEVMKQEISPVVRSLAWDKFSELTQEARRLKEIFESESAFTGQQFTMAIESLEQELEKFTQGAIPTPELQFTAMPDSLESLHVYKVFQKELSVLNVFADRIHSLRKELVKTNMRIKAKNQLFNRLSNCGDKVFPLRKDLIDKISDQFIKDVESFISVLQNRAGQRGGFMNVRDEIKSYQSFAKEIMLNQPAFKKSRQLLSKAWDTVKELDRTRRSEQEKRIEESKAKAEPILNQIKGLTENFKENKISFAEAQQQEKQIFEAIRTAGVGKPEQKQLKDALGEIENLLLQVKSAEAAERKREKEAQAVIRREAFEALKNKVDEKPASSEQLEALEKEIKDSKLLDEEKDELLLLLDPAKDTLLDLEQEKSANKEDYQRILDERIQRRKEIRDELNRLRKSLGSSALDLKQQLANQEMVKNLKDRLEVMEKRIQQLEKML